jgi:hypothetical protein
MTLAPQANPGAGKRFEASDARADDRRRVVMVERDRIVIARSLDGVFMRIALEPSAYRGVVLRLASLGDSGFRYEVRLAHRDPDFGVLLAESDDEADAEYAWRHWARFLKLPELVERVEGTDEPARTLMGAVALGQPGARRLGRGLRLRRPRFLTRRKVGRPEFCVGIDVEATEMSGPDR